MGVVPECWGLEGEKCGCPEILGSGRERIGVARMPNTWRLALLGCPGCWGLGVWGDRGAGNLEAGGVECSGCWKLGEKWYGAA